MKINFPATGYVTYACGPGVPSHFVTAPLKGAFQMEADVPAVIGQNYTIRDDAGTALTYRLLSVLITGDDWLRGEGELVAVEHVEPNVIRIADHDAKVSSSIDIAFEAGRQVGHQEAAEAVAAKALNVTINTSSVTVVQAGYEPDTGEAKATSDEASAYPSGWLGGIDKGEAAACACGVCDTARYHTGGNVPGAVMSRVGERAGESVIWKPRYGPVGNRLDDE
ncbi:hypothetical protein EVB78_015 [Rhizobium phage RHph_N1_15]|nr:hypothetical protein EVB78_015 [Rhizobium phage RHph_N1_15]QIG75077.1 hypothetical protein EVC15_015 [Rhizobium phage RHph_N2_6]